MRKCLIHLTAITLLTASSAFAQIQPGKFTVSPFVGGTNFDSEAKAESGFTGGIRVGYDFVPRFGSEITGAVALTQIGAKHFTVSSYRLDGLYYLRPSRSFVPFLVAGIGGLHNDSGLGKHGMFMAEYGLGLKYFVTESTALRADARNLVAFDRSEQNHQEYTLGLAVYLGKEKPAPAPVAAPAPKPAPAPAPVVQKPVPAPVVQKPVPAPVVAPAPAPVAPVTPPAPKVEPAPKPVPPPVPTTSLSLAPTSVTQGQSTTINWSADNARNCLILPGVGAVPTTGSVTVIPEGETTYTLTCSGPGGTASSTAKVAVVAPEPPPAAVPKQAPVVAEPEKKKIFLEIEFKTGGADVASKYHDKIAKVAEFMKENPTATGYIEGYTDNVGNKNANIKLSQRRAESVRQYLIDKFRIEPSRLQAKGFGPARPIADNSTAAGRQKNRRIEATFDTAGK